MHPCRAIEPFKVKKDGYYDPTSLEIDQNLDKNKVLDDYFLKIEEMLSNDSNGKFKMIGECGLDYDRFEFADKET